MEEFIKKESLNENIEMQPTFSIEDLDEDDEVWVVDIPGTVSVVFTKFYNQRRYGQRC